MVVICLLGYIILLSFLLYLQDKVKMEMDLAEKRGDEEKILRRLKVKRCILIGVIVFMIGGAASLVGLFMMAIYNM